MNRAILAGFFAVLVVGCQSGPEALKIPPRPTDGQPLAYADEIQLARSQATTANEAFTVDKWLEVEEAAAWLEDTARRIPNAPGVPQSLRASLPSQSAALLADVQLLRESAKKKDEDKTNAALARIYLRVRKMRPD